MNLLQANKYASRSLNYKFCFTIIDGKWFSYNIIKKGLNENT